MKDLEFDSRYLNPLTDFGFHRLFGTDQGKELLIHFLNEIIREEGLITDIQYLPTEHWGYAEHDRKAVFDLFCTTETGDYFIVEMQKAKQAYFQDRTLFYASLPILKQAVRGEWNYKLKPVYLVAILNFVIFDEFEEDKEQVIEYAYLTRERRKTRYSKNLNFIFVELPKFKKTLQELKTNTDKWLFVLKNLYRLQEQPKEIGGKVFKNLFELAELKRLTKREMGRYKKSILDYYDVQNALEYAREEASKEGFKRGVEEGAERGRQEGTERGRKEGIEKGRIEGRIEGIEEVKASFLQRCLQKNTPVEDIISFTEFFEEQIKHYGEKGD